MTSQMLRALWGKHGSHALLVAPLIVMGCKEPDPAPAPAPSAPLTAPEASAATSAEPPSTPTQPAASASAQMPEEPLQLLRLTFTSGISNKNPEDTLAAAAPGQRVYAHLVLRNRSASQRQVHLEFRVNGDKRTTIDLPVERSWSYRTWAYNTLRPTDKRGAVSLRVTDDTGAVLADTSVPIQAVAQKKPAP